jgi:hypothetical protein
MGDLSEEDRAAALGKARDFREKHPAGSPGALAVFDGLSKTMQFAIRILASIAGGVAAQPHA